MNATVKMEDVLDADALWREFSGMSSQTSEADWSALCENFSFVIESAFGSTKPALKRESEIAVHRVLYAIYAGRIASMLNDGWKDVDSFHYDQMRVKIESAWEASQRRELFRTCAIPQSAAEFESWAFDTCMSHRSNVTHPLFSFLKESATFSQLREFFLQETPFDIHFGDILTMMLPGVYGREKIEFAKNLWDELGRGHDVSVHRNLRLQMMAAIDVCPDVHLKEVDLFCLEELRLANMYFKAVFNKSKLIQSIGMMLATELMVPGRLDYQIEGWRRVGMQDSQMQYLIEHTIVDVEHAKGWMNEVVMPLIESRPELISDLVFGIVQRLQYAVDVCDVMLDRFTKS